MRLQVLTDFKADPSKVRFNRLVGFDLQVEHDPKEARGGSPSRPRLVSRQNSALERGERETADAHELVECEVVSEQVQDLDEYHRLSPERCPVLDDWEDPQGGRDKEFRSIRNWCDPRSQVGPLAYHTYLSYARTHVLTLLTYLTHLTHLLTYSPYSPYSSTHLLAYVPTRVRAHSPEQVGFAVLAHWMDELGGYVNVHLEARHLNKGPDAQLRPEWSDIFLWAVLVS